MGDDQRSHTWLELGRVLSLLECCPIAILKFFIIIFEYKPQHFHLALGPPVMYPVLVMRPQLVCMSPQMNSFTKQVLLGPAVGRCDSWSRVCLPVLTKRKRQIDWEGDATEACVPLPCRSPSKPLGGGLEILKVYLCEIVSPVPSLSPPVLSGSDVRECFWLS